MGLAVNDVVNGISAANTILDYQPASGVEVVITVSGTDTVANQIMRLYNGTIDSLMRANSTSFSQDTSNMKVLITNSIYFRTDALGVGLYSAYTGMVTKA